MLVTVENSNMMVWMHITHNWKIARNLNKQLNHDILTDN